MPLFIVTIKVERNKDHDPKNKVGGECSVSLDCTDVTGEHHSLLVKADSRDEIDYILKEIITYKHITRIEEASGRIVL